MESKNLNSSGEAVNKSLSDMKKDFVKGVRKMNSTKEIPDYSGEFADAVKEHADEDFKQYAADPTEDFETVEEYEESLEKSSVKGVGWLLGIVAAFVVCVGIAALVGHKDSPYSSRSNGKAVYSAVDAGKAKAPEANEVGVYGVYESETIVPIDGAKKAVGNAANTVGNAVDKAGNAVAKAASTAATAVKGAATSAASAVKGAVKDQGYDDRIEREAREVIHGDYGNNPERAKELGPDYAAVQERVNEILNGVQG